MRPVTSPARSSSPWNTLVGTDGRFLPREQLQARLAAARVVPGKPVVAYCMVGMRASVVYFVAQASRLRRQAVRRVDHGLDAEEAAGEDRPAVTKTRDRL